MAGSTFAVILGADDIRVGSDYHRYFYLLVWLVSFNFWTVILDLWRCCLKKNVELPLPQEAGPIDQATRIALIMPVYNEEMARIYASLRATYESLKATGQLERFDIFILSDSVDSEAVLMEETAWSDLCGIWTVLAGFFTAAERCASIKKAGMWLIFAGAGAVSINT